MEFKKEDMQTVRITASGILVPKPCWLFCIIGNSYADANSSIEIHDGLDTTGRKFMDLSGSKYGSDILVFGVPLYFANGIYANFHTNGYSVFAQFLLEY